MAQIVMGKGKMRVAKVRVGILLAKNSAVNTYTPYVLLGTQLRK